MIYHTVHFDFEVLLAGIMSLSYLSQKVNVRNSALRNAKFVILYCSVYIKLKLSFLGSMTKIGRGNVKFLYCFKKYVNKYSTR